MRTASSEQRASWSLTGSRALRSAASFRATAGEISGRWRPTGTRRRSCVDRVRARRRGDAVASASHLHKSGGRAVEIAGERRLDGRPPHRLAQGASRGRLLMGSGIAGRAIGRSRETLVTSPQGTACSPKLRFRRRDISRRSPRAGRLWDSCFASEAGCRVLRAARSATERFRASPRACRCSPRRTAC
jgi:hypothetical protein